LIVGAPASGRSGFPFTTYLVRGSWRIKLADEFRKAVRNPLSHNVVVHGPELVADSRLDFGVEAALPAGWGALGLRFCILHDLFHIFPG
jgi:hypothetical protein